MNAEEALRLDFLKAAPERHFARNEIARRAVKRTCYEKHPQWAEVPLALVAPGPVEHEDGGYSKFKPGEQF
jgi:hypothetical protein